jgi:hypothetical protein
LQLLYTIRWELQLVERIEFDILFRWFVGLSIGETVFDASTFSKNRDRFDPAVASVGLGLARATRGADGVGEARGPRCRLVDCVRARNRSPSRRCAGRSPSALPSRRS